MAYYFFFTSLHVVVALDEDRNVFYMPRVELKTCRRVRIVLQKKKIGERKGGERHEESNEECFGE